MEEKNVQINFKISERPSSLAKSKLLVNKTSPTSSVKTDEIKCDNPEAQLLNQTIDLCQDENSILGLSSCSQPIENKTENIVEIVDLCKDQNEVIILKDMSKTKFIKNNYTPVIDLSEDGNEGIETESGVKLNDDAEMNDDILVIKTCKNNPSPRPCTQSIAHSQNCLIKSARKILKSTANYSSKKNRVISQAMPKISKRKEKKKLKKMLKHQNKLRVDGAHQENLVPRPCSSEVGKNICFNSPVSLPSSGLRPIIIDGNNVAIGNVGIKNREFSCKKLKICIDFFKKRGHKVTAFVPQFRTKFNKSDNPALLNKLVQDGDVILTPSKIVEGKSIVPYDDRFIVQTAVLKGGVIVSRDNFRDLLRENPAWTETINYRTLPFTWVDDVLMFPNDPLGMYGPSLDEFLKFH